MLNTLRARLFALFAPLAVAPLLIVGVSDYLRAERAVEQMLTAQTDTAARRAARILDSRFSLLQSDEQLLATNVVTQRLLRSSQRTSRGAASAGLDSASRQYLDGLWEQFQSSYYGLQLRNRDGRVLVAYGEPVESPAVIRRPALTYDVHDDDGGSLLGTLLLAPRLDLFIPAELTRLGFGWSGYNAIVDRQSGTVIDHPAARFVGAPSTAWLGAAASKLAETPAGSFLLGSGDSLRVASFASIDGTPWLVISTTAVTEFAAALVSMRRIDLLLLAVLGLIVSVGVFLFARRATASLEVLTVAARSIGRGNLSPALPAPSEDEVGVLSATMSEMIQRLQMLVREIEVSRQMAVIGEFASQIAHEIRNPLTSLNLELQGLARDKRAGAWTHSSDESLDTCLHEVRRLDRVVRGVLRLARPSVHQRVECSVATIVDRALGALSRELAERSIRVERGDDHEEFIVVGDPEALEGALINLLRNAVEAQPAGGRIGVFQHGRAGDVEIVVVDDGAGVATEDRDRIFRPFVTSRADGTGLGLPMVLRVAREHRGSVVLNGGVPGYRGAAFALSLPLADRAAEREATIA